ncbi:MAG: putative acyl-CoA thioester hydrolase [Candidatus Heimdallarchaeota archaeon LC_3]|nr:MAG: putative acyl-CoA thioester hydrolase [Candidatus Heimdallarchaeota archaeon LC_3]
MNERSPKKISDSRVTTYKSMMPEHSNPSPDSHFKNVNGGVILNLIDNIAGIVALRHTRTRVVTASFDAMEFLHPVRVGELLIIKSSINFVGTSSMEVGVKVMVEDFFTGETNVTGRAYLTFVAVDQDGKPIPAPKLILETDDDHRRFKQAQERRKIRLEHRQIRD